MRECVWIFQQEMIIASVVAYGDILSTENFQLNKPLP